MDVEKLKCDIFEVLQNDDRTILQKWISTCRAFRSRVAAKLKERFLLEADDTKKKSVNAGKISELQQEINTVKSKKNDTVLEQKKADKQISKATNSQGKLKTELDELNVQSEALSLEIMNLQIETEDKKKKKVFQWDAVKRACTLYKVNLDIHISLQEEKDCQKVTFSFFTHIAQGMYFVLLSCSQDCWKVERIEPKIKKEHLNELSSITDYPEYSKVSDVTLFLCQLRNIYLKYYMKRENNCRLTCSC